MRSSNKSSLRSRSLDTEESEEKEEEEEEKRAPLYKVLAEYTAISAREVELQEGEMVSLVKIGCAGWWYVRRLASPHTEGWAPSTYLQLLPEITKTLGRK